MASIPDPTPGLVISYFYLWRQEAAKGRDEGSKKRPCVVVLATRSDEGSDKTALVAPITHSPPDDPSAAVEIPPGTGTALVSMKTDHGSSSPS